MTSSEALAAGSSEGRRTVLVPDLGDKLTLALDQVNEMLVTLAVHDDVLLPPLRNRRALSAFRRVQAALRPTQTTTEDPPGGRLLGPDGRAELVNLRPAVLDLADLETLGDAVTQLRAALNAHPAMRLAHAMADGAMAAGWVTPHGPPPEPEDVVATLAQVHQLLSLVDDQHTAVFSAAVAPANRDVVLTGSQMAAYEHVLNRIKHAWPALGNVEDRPGERAETTTGTDDGLWIHSADLLAEVRAAAAAVAQAEARMLAAWRDAYDAGTDRAEIARAAGLSHRDGLDQLRRRHGTTPPP